MPAFSSAYSKAFDVKVSSGPNRPPTDDPTVTVVQQAVEDILTIQYVRVVNPTAIHDWVSLYKKIHNSRYVK